MKGRGFLVVVMMTGLATLLLGVGLLRGQPAQATDQAQPPPASEPGGLGLRLDTAWSLAEEAARGWASDAQLVDLSATWAGADEQALLEGPRAWTLVFYSPGRSAVLYVAAGPGRARPVREAQVHTSLPTVDTPAGPIGPEEAVMVFLGRGGRAFLEEHPGATVHLRLGSRGGQGAKWILLAIDPEQGSQFGLSVDATTGEVRFATDLSDGGGA